MRVQIHIRPFFASPVQGHVTDFPLRMRKNPAKRLTVDVFNFATIFGLTCKKRGYYRAESTCAPPSPILFLKTEAQGACEDRPLLVALWNRRDRSPSRHFARRTTSLSYRYCRTGEGGVGKLRRGVLRSSYHVAILRILSRFIRGGMFRSSQSSYLIRRTTSHPHKFPRTSFGGNS